MCLTTIAKKLDPPDPNIVRGWKKFRLRRDQVSHRNVLNFQYYTLNYRMFVPRGKWIRAEPIVEYGYKTGFHFYLKSSRNERTPVLLRNITVIGRQGVDEVNVAQEMFVPYDSQEIIKLGKNWFVRNKKTLYIPKAFVQ